MRTPEAETSGRELQRRTRTRVRRETRSGLLRRLRDVVRRAGEAHTRSPRAGDGEAKRTDATGKRRNRMKVLDANFLIDYLAGDGSTKEFYEATGGDEELWVMPVPAYAEALVGVGNVPDGDVLRAVDSLAWAEVYDVNEELALTAAEIADEIGAEGPYLDGRDALIAAVGRKLNAPVVSWGSDLTHEETRRVVDVEAYR